MQFNQSFGDRLRQQLTLLRGVNSLYDQGVHDHALSIAARVSVIVEMLRSQEGGVHLQKAGVLFQTPVPTDPEGNKPVAPLVSKQTYVNDAFLVVSQANLPAYQDKSYKPVNSVKLAKWLNQSAFLYAPDKSLSRENLINLMRNKDGGGHPYSLVPPEYIAFAQDGGALSLKVTGDNIPEPMPPIHYASMRHISFEVEAAIAQMI